jgi:simple sugar transport system substrate-binding protein
VSDEAKKRADDVMAKLTAGDYVIFKGPIKDNTGRVVVAAGDELIQTNATDEKLESMAFLVDGVMGSLPS